MLFDAVFQTILAPLLIAQALQVRRRALILPEADGPRQGRCGQGPVLRLLVTGDSAAAGVGADHQDHALVGQLVARLSENFTVEWQLEARTGADTRAALKHLQSIPAQPFDVVVTSLGVNDVTGGRFLPRWLDEQRALQILLVQKFQARCILVSGVPPMGHFPLLPRPLRWVLGRRAARFDTYLSRLCAQAPQVTHLPFDGPVAPELMARDGFHPGPQAYGEWAGALVRHIPTAP